MEREYIQKKTYKEKTYMEKRYIQRENKLGKGIYRE